jgi:acetolactate synthase-1/2/3 large subunit
MNTSPTRGRQYLCIFLAEKGVTHAFGIIGAGNAALFDAIARLAKTEIVCCHHEAAAVMAATYYGRARGTCGVAIVTTGAGSSNAITGALAANMDSALCSSSAGTSRPNTSAAENAHSRRAGLLDAGRSEALR